MPSEQPEVLAHGEGESTSNGIMLMIGDDGIAREYSDEFDVVIHCESEEEREKVIEIINSKQWIPCSERLPEKGEYGKVLVTYIPSGGTLWVSVIIAHYSDLMGIAKPSFHIGEVGKESFQNITKQVIAWMPLPDPWEVEG